MTNGFIPLLSAFSARSEIYEKTMILIGMMTSWHFKHFSYSIKMVFFLAFWNDHIKGMHEPTGIKTKINLIVIYQICFIKKWKTVTSRPHLRANLLLIQFLVKAPGRPLIKVADLVVSQLFSAWLCSSFCKHLWVNQRMEDFSLCVSSFSVTLSFKWINK